MSRHERKAAFLAVLMGIGLHVDMVQAKMVSRHEAEVIAAIDAQAKDVQVMVDQIFSFAEPGFQEFRTSDYLQDVLARKGFKITKGVAGIPTAFTATWGEGGPLIGLGSDIDSLLGVSQFPGVTEPKAMVEGAPGHGEGHNSGMPLIVAAAVAIKQVMEKHHMPGRLMIWPGVAEELLGSKAYYIETGLFRDVDACIFVHVSDGFSTNYGDIGTNAAISVEYKFSGKAAHAALGPWDGHSALDAVEIMNIAWNFRREHLPLTQRSHYVITNGGWQPNIVPSTASVWYYFRDRSSAAVRSLYETSNVIADAAAQATGTTVQHKILGYAATYFGNKPLAEAAFANIKRVGMPNWSPSDQEFARTVQRTNGRREDGLRVSVTQLAAPEPAKSGGGSDDIGNVMWTVPTITIFYPANIPNLVGHNEQSAMAMATPIAHKGVLAGAKAVALTIIDAMTKPDLLSDAQAYFKDVQLKTGKYDPVLQEPAIGMNAKVMQEMRPRMEPFYYDSSKFPTYLDQLGIDYPVTRKAE